MRQPRLLAVAVSAILLAACSSTTPVSKANLSPTPTAASGQPTLAIPSPTVPFVRCDTAGLEMRLIFLGVGLGNVGGLIEVRNKASHDCDLVGYAGLVLLDAQSRSEPTQVVWSNSSYIFGANLPESVIGLPADTVPITPERPVAGHAYIPISWNEVQEPCSSPAQFKVTPPDASTSLTISSIPPGGGPGLPLVCSGGTVIVNPIRAAFYR